MGEFGLLREHDVLYRVEERVEGADELRITPLSESEPWRALAGYSSTVSSTFLLP